MTTIILSKEELKAMEDKYNAGSSSIFSAKDLFISKPVLTTAWQFSKEEYNETKSLPRFVEIDHNEINDGLQFYVEVNGVPCPIFDQDWVIIDTEGNPYPCPDRVFKAKYSNCEKDERNNYPENWLKQKIEEIEFKLSELKYYAESKKDIKPGKK